MAKQARKVLLTGCNTGIGMGLALRLLEEGFFLIGCCRKPQYFALLHARFSSVSDQFELFAFDLDSDFSDSLEAILDKHGVPDAIINNAGVYPRQNSDFEKNWEEVEYGMRVNVKAPMRVCEFFKSGMHDKPWGRIINVSSKMGSISDNGSGGSYPYRASKVALNMYSVNLAREFNDSKVKVFPVHPGWIQTRMGGMGAPDEVPVAVERIMFSLSDEAEKYHGEFLVGSNTIPW